MNSNVERFGLFTVKILDILYDSFPVATGIDKNEIIEEFLQYKRDDNLEKVRTQTYLIDIAESLNCEDLFEGVSENKERIRDVYRALQEEKDSQRQHHEGVYMGTIDFLVEEGLIRECSGRGYQLTAKAFTHLNQRFSNGKISKNDSSIIQAIQKIFSKSSDVSLSVATGVAVKVVTKILGY